ncbi:hypothetical protein BKA69DRAFT_1085271 [Paraphysoderma sedebokerense]|nr:hypothetical protein BKA69DRAFT_1085271 [Paraphysoderma sedebokerense]
MQCPSRFSKYSSYFEYFFNITHMETQKTRQVAAQLTVTRKPTILHALGRRLSRARPSIAESVAPSVNKIYSPVDILSSIIFKNELPLAVLLSFLVAIAFGFSLRFLSSSTDINTFEQQLNLGLNLILFQAFPCFLVTIIMLLPFERNFPSIFQWTDVFSIAVIAVSFILNFGSNAYLMTFGMRNEEFTFALVIYWVIVIFSLPCIPVACRLRLYYVRRNSLENSKTNLKENQKLESSAETNLYDNFSRFTPFGPAILITTISAGLSYSFLVQAPWAVVFLLLFCFGSAGLYYRDHTKTFSKSVTTSSFLLWYDPKNEFFRDTLKPNWWYMLGWGLGLRIFGLLGQIYSGTICALSSQATSDVTGCLVNNLSYRTDFGTHLILKLLFRFFGAVATTTMEYISVLAFVENDFLHFSYFWRHTEDLIVTIGLMNSNGDVLTIVLLVLQFVLVVAKDGGFIEDVIFSITHRKWIYNMDAYVEADPQFLLRMFDQIRTQTIRSKLNFYSRVTAAVYIATIAVFDKIFAGAGGIWPNATFEKSIVLFFIIFLELLVSRWLCLMIFAKKTQYVIQLYRRYCKKNEQLNREIEEFEIDDTRVISKWRRLLFTLDVASMLILTVDLNNLPI